MVISRVETAVKSIMHAVPPADKWNEDRFSVDQEIALAVVADGVTRPRRADGSYPYEEGDIAPELLVRLVPEFLRREATSSYHCGLLQQAIGRANAAIGAENKKKGLDSPDFVHSDYLGTVFVALWIPKRGWSDGFAVLAYLGDCKAFLLRGDEVVFYTPSQVDAWDFHWRQYCSQIGREDEDSGANVRRHAHQREYVRNRGDRAIGLDGKPNPQLSFGVLTGEESALEHVRIRILFLQPGDRIVLSSDAFRACAGPRPDGAACESSAEYAPTFDRVRGVSGWTCAKELLRLTRERELERGLRSDDATFAVVDVT